MFGNRKKASIQCVTSAVVCVCLHKTPSHKHVCDTEKQSFSDGCKQCGLLHRSPTIPHWDDGASELPVEGEDGKELRDLKRTTCPSKLRLKKHCLIIPWSLGLCEDLVRSRPSNQFL